MSFIVFLIVFFIFFMLILPDSSKKKMINIKTPESLDPYEKARLFLELGKKTVPPRSTDVPMDQYIEKLLAYMLMRCRLLGFPEGSVISLRDHEDKEHSVTV